MKKNILKIMAVITSIIVLQSCKPVNLPQSPYTIKYPVNNASYVGTVNNGAPIKVGSSQPLAAKFEIEYSVAPQANAKIVLNGQGISKYFVYGPKSATADIEKIKQFFRQGKNTLTVDMLNFGPKAVFYLDTAGPNLIITRGKMSADAKRVEIKGYMRDPSAFSDKLKLDLVQITGYSANGSVQRSLARSVNIAVNPDGTFCACTYDSTDIDITGLIVNGENYVSSTPLKRSLLYSFKVADVNGFESVEEYIADSDGTATMPIDSAVRVAVGDSFIESMRPIIASGLYTSLQTLPIDARIDAWDNPLICNGKKGVISGKDMTQAEEDAVPGTQAQACSPAGVKDGTKLSEALRNLKVDIGLGNMPTTVNRFYMANGGTLSDGTVTGVGTALLNGFKIKKNNILGIDMVITEILADLTIDAGFLGNIDLAMYIQRIVVDTDAAVSAQGKKVNVELQNSNFSLEGIKLTKTKILGIEIKGLANLLIPLLEGLIADMLPGIMNPILKENLQKLRAGGTVTQPENATTFDMVLKVADMGTGNLLGDGNPYDLLVSLESVANVTKSDAAVSPMLGPIYTDDPIDPYDVYNAWGENGTNLSVAVNSNLINQSLGALYAVGASHFTMYNGTVYYGANAQTPAKPGDATKTIAVEGDTRVRLWPDLPPQLGFKDIAGSQGAGEAEITYESATLSLDTYRKVNGVLKWDTDLELSVNFDLGVTINEDNGVFTMGADGPPVFTINKMVNYSKFQVPKSVVQGVVDIAMSMGGDVLADRFVVLDLGTIAEKQLNGKQVYYLSDKDDYKITGNACVQYDSAGNPILVANTGTIVAGQDKKYDLVCENIEFVVNTNTVGVTGAKGNNLFFQMEARDPALPAAPAIPRFDLDSDGKIDYQDNCKVAGVDLSDAVATAGGLPGNIDANGNPKAGFEDAVRLALNNIYKTRYGGGADPTATQITNWNNLRVSDSPLTAAQLGTYKWVKLMFSNPSQYNSDGDRVGELCEDDADLDGIYTDNGAPVDNCPSLYNPDQADTMYPPGVGDACNVRANFVMLRSLESGSLCLTRAGLTGTAWVSDTLKTMATCNSADANQRWYMKALNPNDLNGGVEFYNNASRNGNSDFRLTGYGYAVSDGAYAADPNNFTRVDEMRLLRTDNATMKGQNDDSVSACGWGAGACYRTEERADPVFFLRAAGSSNSYDENSHPWYLDTSFGTGRNSVIYPYPFANSGWTNIGKDSCMTYTSGWGVDIGSSGDGEFCASGARWRWAILVGGTSSPWNGIW